MDLRVKDIGEDQLIADLIGEFCPVNEVLVGPGDDCAVIDPGPQSKTLQLLKTDCMIEGIHFLPGTDSEKVGWKAMCRVISDMAAMGGLPGHALVTLAVDSDRTVSEVQGWYAGMRAAMKAYGNFTIVGGETARLPSKGAIISIALTGRVERYQYATRSGAQPGDWIAVTGALGGSFSSGRHLEIRPRLAEARWLMQQPDRLRPTAMMDLSDGLAKDLPRLAKMSNIPGYELDLKTIPINTDSELNAALSEGEDYELLLTFGEEALPELKPLWESQFPNCRLTSIGKMTNQPERTLIHGGWEHFSS